MMIVQKIAFRNLREHKVKTAIVGLLIAFAIFVMVAGNSLMDSVNNGMRQSYATNYTGDLILHGVSEDSFSLIPMGPVSSDIPVVPAFAKLRGEAESLPAVAAVLPLISGTATISVDEEAAGISFLWGVNFPEYQFMFPGSLAFIEGGFPAVGEASILLSEKVRANAEKELNRTILVGDSLTLGGYGAAGMRLREVKIAGIIRFERAGMQLEQISIVDAATLRSLKGMTTAVVAGANGAESIPGAGTESMSEDDLFGAGTLVRDGAGGDTGADTGPANYDAILGDVSVRGRYAALDSDAWNFLLIRLSDPSLYAETKKAMEASITEAGIAAGLSDWRWGAGMVADLAYSIQIIFNVIVLVISIVAIIIIMNTLVISVTERIPEIGTIRAIGGGKSFVRSMILWETLVIAIIFGALGIFAGAVVVGISNSTGIESANQFIQLLFGGATLRPTLSGSAVAYSLAATVAIGILSSLYPVSVALRVSPVVAMQRV
jgi:putative ABC transport system permease protein